MRAEKYKDYVQTPEMFRGTNIRIPNEGDIMELARLSKIEEELNALDCKAYSLSVQFDDSQKVTVEKIKKESDRKIGFNDSRNGE
jgi:hypothetical protein